MSSGATTTAAHFRSQGASPNGKPLTRREPRLEHSPEGLPLAQFLIAHSQEGAAALRLQIEFVSTQARKARVQEWKDELLAERNRLRENCNPPDAQEGYNAVETPRSSTRVSDLVPFGTPRTPPVALGEALAPMGETPSNAAPLQHVPEANVTPGPPEIARANQLGTKGCLAHPWLTRGGASSRQ